MSIRIDEDNLKQGILALVIALVEVIRDALVHQAERRFDAGTLTPDEVDRLGASLESLDEAIEKIRDEHGIQESVRSIREGLDDVVDDFVDRLLNPGRWLQEDES